MAANAPGKLKIFISYSRKDMQFADRLAAALEVCGFKIIIDRQSLPVLEDWRRELLDLIRVVDTVLFIISPRSIASPVCAWEIEQVAAMNKRLAPVVMEQVDNDKIPAAITKINYLYFDSPNKWDIQIEALAGALKRDNEWLKEHSRLSALAIRWQENGQPASQLLRQVEIDAARRWAARRPKDAPPPPKVLFDFLTASSKHENVSDQDRRRVIALAFVKPALQALDQGLSEYALRLAAAGGLLAKDLDFVLAPELWSPAARAIFENRTRMVLRGHAAAVLGASFCADGQRIVTASDDNTVRVWSTKSGKEIALMSVPKARSAIFSPDGRQILTISRDDKLIQLWDTKSTAAIRIPTANCARIICATFGRDGPLVATESYKDGILLYNVVTGKTISIKTKSLFFPLSFDIHNHSAYYAVFSSDGRRLLIAFYDGAVRIYDAQWGRGITVLKGRLEWINSASFSSDGRRIVTVSYNSAKIWDAENGKEISALTGDVASARNAAFSSDGSKIALAHEEKTASIWDTDSGQQIVVLKAHEDRVNNVAFSPDGYLILTASDDKTVRVWDARRGNEIAFLGHGEESASFSPNSRRIVTAGYNSVSVWDVESGKEKKFSLLMDAHPSVRSAAFSPDGSRIVIVLKDKDTTTARLLKARDGKQILVLKGHSDSVLSAAFSPNSRNIITASLDKTARVWDAKTGLQAAIFMDHAGAVLSASFGHDGQLILTTSDDKTARVWDAKSGSQIAMHADVGGCAAFSPDAKYIAAAYDDNTIRIFDAMTGANAIILRGHQRQVNAVSFSPDGDRVVTASNDGTTRVWQAETGLEVARLCQNSGSITSACFSPNGRLVATTSNKHCCVVWDVSLTELLMRDRAMTLAAAITYGIGWSTDEERSELLMKDVSADLLAEVMLRLGDNAKDVKKTAATLRRRLHHNCYLSHTRLWQLRRRHAFWPFS